MRKVAMVLVLAVLSCGAAWADDLKPAEAPDQHVCIVARTIHGWSRIDNQTFLVRAAPQKNYRVTFWGQCREANWAYSARVENFGMCLRPGDVLIFDIDSPWPRPRWSNRWSGPFERRRSGFEERCVIKTIERIPPDVTPASSP